TCDRSSCGVDVCTFCAIAALQRRQSRCCSDSRSHCHSGPSCMYSGLDSSTTGCLHRSGKGTANRIEETMIELRNIERSYRAGHTETWVLRRVNLTIQPWEFITVMGPSGAGKSSLLNVIGMLYDQWKGEFSFADETVHKMNRKQRADLARRKIGMVFQSYHLLDDLTVAENIDLPL